MLEQLGRKPFEEDVVRGWVGNGAQTLVKRALLGKREIEEVVDETLFDQALAIFFDYYQNHLAVHTTLYEGVKETLEVLKKHGYLLAIVTNKPYGFIQPILDGLELNTLFERLLGGDSLDRKKPDPLPLTYMCEQFNVFVDQTVMVGDSKNDILAARAANIQSIGVTYGYNYGENIAVYKPDVVVEHFSDILEVLK
jgi:phosphoglycolate phosphatase